MRSDSALPANSRDPGELLQRMAQLNQRGVPKYAALHGAVVNAVATGSWPAGTRVPNEVELARVLPVSLGTVQRAFRMLVEEGILIRRQGRGSFVADQRTDRMHAPLHCRFVDDATHTYLPVYPKVVSRRMWSSPGPWSAHLGAHELILIEREIDIADEFVVWSRFFADPLQLPAFARLDARELSGANFKEVINRETGHLIGRLVQFLAMIALPAEIASVLRVQAGTLGQRLDVLAFAGNQRPIYYQELYIPPNGRRLHLAASGKDPGY